MHLTNKKRLPAWFALIWLLLPFSANAQDWQRVATPLRSTITAVSFPDQATGYLLTIDGQLARSVDAGASWTQLSTNVGPQAEDMHWRSATEGYFCARNGRIFRTADGGTEIKAIPLPDTVCWPVSIFAVTERILLVTALSREADVPIRGQLWRSTDGGSSWTKLQSEGLGFAELSQAPDGRILFPSFGRLHSSKDQGATWSLAATIEGKPGRALSFSGTRMLLVGSFGMCAVSADGGSGWTQVSPAEDEYDHFLAALSRSTRQSFIGGAAGSLYRTDDGGLTWTAENLPITIDIFDMASTGRKIFAVGAKGSVYARTVK